MRSTHPQRSHVPPGEAGFLGQLAGAAPWRRSPGSTRPLRHAPRPSPEVCRGTRRSCPSSITIAPTQTPPDARSLAGLTAEGAVHDDGPGGEPEALEEVLHRSISGQVLRRRTRAAMPNFGTTRAPRMTTSPTPTSRASGSHIDVVEHGRGRSRREPLDVERYVLHDDVVVLPADDNALRSVEQQVVLGDGADIAQRMEHSPRWSTSSARAAATSSPSRARSPLRRRSGPTPRRSPRLDLGDPAENGLALAVLRTRGPETSLRVRTATGCRGGVVLFARPRSES